jgi:outer membrane protein assembly factor BamB
MKTTTIIAILAAALVGTSSSAPVATEERSILTYHGDSNRSGNFIVPTLTWARARSVHLDQSFDARVAGHVYTQPLYWRAGESDTARLLVATEDNVVQAFDAKTGKELWRQSVGSPVPRSSLPCGNIDPLGITGTPVIDQATQAIFLDAAVEGPSGPRHRIFALSLKDGSILQGWPIDVADALRTKGLAFDPRDQNQRGALTILDDRLYVPFGGHFGDCGDYHGWIVGVSLRDPRQVVSWEARARGGGIWAPGGLSVTGGDLFLATGNTIGATSWSDGEAVWRVAPDLHRTNDKRDFFAPLNWRALDQSDADLGGTNPIPLDVPTPTGSQALVLALGKDGRAYLLDRNDLGGIGGQLAAETVSDQPIGTAPAVYPATDSVFVAFQGKGAHCPTPSPDNALSVLKIESGSPPTMTTAWCGALKGAGSAIVTTTDGHSNPIVWIVGAEGDNRLHGFKGDTGEPLFTGNGLGDLMSGLRHFQALIATKDRLYVGADGHIYAFSF